jgi:peptide/nickel transport system substrate-binding protein
LDLRQADFNSHPFGTGPFRVVEWKRGDRIVLEPNAFFRPKPRLRRIDIIMMPNAQAAMLAIRAKDIDIASIGWPQIPDARRVGDARIIVTPTNQVSFLFLQVAAAPTSDVRVRRAIAAAIGKRWMLLGSFGMFKPGDSFLSPLFSWHDASPRSIVADPSRVANQLVSAGWKMQSGSWTKNGTPLSLTIISGGSPGLITQEALRRAGFPTDVKILPPLLFNAPDGPVRRGHFNVLLDGWIGGSDPEQSVVFACSQRGPNGSNRSNYCNARFEAAYYDQAVTTSAARRRSDFIQMQRIIREDVPAVPLSFVATIDLVSNRVTGFRRNMLTDPVGAETWDTR